MKIGIFTGGGDCPGLNPVIRAAVRHSINQGNEVIGFKDGWKGLIENKYLKLDADAVSGILSKGGTILGTSRTNPYKKENALKKLVENFKRRGLSALIAVGGEDTLGVAAKLTKDGIPNIVGVPKTIDNDLSLTDYTFGFDSALNIIMESIDRLRTTAESHHRIIVVEIMGRHAGWLATLGGIAGGADVILIPEVPFDLDEVCNLLKKRHQRRKAFSIVAVAEGAKFKKTTLITQKEKLDEFGHVRLGGIGQLLSAEIEKRTGCETRLSILGHLQRGGTPTAFDRVLGTRFGVHAVELIKKKKFGYMVALSGNKITEVPIKDAVKRLKTVDMQLYEITKIFST